MASTLRRAGRAHRPPRAPGKEGRADLPAQRIPEQRVHQVARSIFPAGRCDDGAGRNRSTSPTCTTASSRSVTSPAPARISARGCSSTDLDKVDPQGPHLAAGVRRRQSRSIRRVAPRPDRAADEQRDAGAAGDASEHPNGWWRDTAQQLLVLKQDKSVVPALQRIVKTSTNLLARFHALWTLEGLGALTAALVRQLMEDPNRGCASRRFARAKRSTRRATIVRRRLRADGDRS